MLNRWLIIVFLTVIVNLIDVSSKSPGDNLFISRHRRGLENTFKRSRNRARNTPDSSVCQTNECRKIADIILNGLQNSTDPCENFYEYSCGGWTEQNILPLTEAIWNRNTNAKSSLEKRLSGILEAGVRPDDIVPVKKAKRWYRSCMDLEALEERGTQPLESIITTVGGWPITMEPGEWNSREFSWQQVEQYYFRLTGSYVLYSVNVPLIKSRNCPDCNVVTMSHPALPLSEHLPISRKRIDPEDIEAYAKLIARVVFNFVEEKRNHIAKYRIIMDVKDMIDFEIALSQIFPQTAHYVIANVEDIQKASVMGKRKNDTSKIDFRKLIESFLEIGNLEVNSLPLINLEIDYIRHLLTLLDQTPSRTIVNYIHWHFISRTMSFTNQKMRDMIFDYVRETFGIQEQRPRSRECIKEMQMHHALAFEYVSKHFSKRVKNDAADIVRAIKRGMESQISNSNWMNEDLKFNSKEKIQSIRMQIGYPNWYQNTTAIIKHYEGMTVSFDYFENNLNHWRFAIKKKLQAWQSTIANDANEWIIDPLSDSAAYIDGINALNLPLIIFQSPLFTKDLPEAVNYAIAGFIIAEQMSYGFDSTGRFFDENGNITEWPERMVKSYRESSECFVQQFDGYLLTNQDAGNATNITHIGNQTLNANIADSSGIQAAFLAYESVIRQKDSTDRKLPGLESYTNEQLFFLIFASTMCEAATPQFLSKRIADNFYSPSRLRLIGTMSNSEAFSRAFQCRRGRPMNPEKKCSIWYNAAENDANWLWVNSKNYMN